MRLAQFAGTLVARASNLNRARASTDRAARSSTTRHECQRSNRSGLQAYVLGWLIMALVALGSSPLLGGAEAQTLATAPQAPSTIIDRPQTYLLLDGSGSMWGAFPGATSRLTAMRATTIDLASRWKYETSTLGLAAYGSRREGDCSDAGIILTPGEDAGRLARNITAIKGRGRTAIATAVEQIGQSMITAPGPSGIILVTDGPENCERDVCAVADSLSIQGNVSVHVITMSMTAEQSQTLACLAERTGGSLQTSQTTTELRRAILRAQSLIETKIATLGVQPVSVTVGNQDLALSSESLVDADQFNLTPEEQQALETLKATASAIAQDAEENRDFTAGQTGAKLDQNSTSSILRALNKPADGQVDGIADLIDLPAQPSPLDRLDGLLSDQEPERQAEIEALITARLAAESQFEQSLEALKQRYAARDQQLREQMRSTMDEAARQLERERQARLKLTELNTAQESTIEEQSEILANLRATLSDETRNKVELASELANERLELRRQLDALNQLQADNTRLNAQIETAESEIRRVSNEYASLKDATAGTRRDGEQAIKRYDELERILERALTDLETMKNERNDLVIRVDALRLREIEAAETSKQLAATLVEADALKQDKQKLQQSLVAGQSEKLRLQADFDALSTRAASLESQNRKLAQQILDTQERFRASQDALKAANQQIARGEQALAAEQARSQRLTEELAVLTRDYQAARESLRQLRQRERDALAKLGAQDQRIATLELLLSRAEAERRTSRQRNQRLQQNQAALSLVLDDVSAQMQNLESTLACPKVGRKDGRVVCLFE